MPQNGGEGSSVGKDHTLTRLITLTVTVGQVTSDGTVTEGRTCKRDPGTYACPRHSDGSVTGLKGGVM